MLCFCVYVVYMLCFCAHIQQSSHVPPRLQGLMVRGSHMLIVHRDAPDPAAYAPYYAIADAPVVGLLTLEDVLEELIQADIHDETDIAHDSPVPATGRRRSRRARLNHLVALYESRYGCVPGCLTEAESAAVAAFLAARVPSLFAQLVRCLK